MLEDGSGGVHPLSIPAIILVEPGDKIEGFCVVFEEGIVGE